MREFAPGFLEDYEGGTVVRISAELREVEAVLEALPAPGLARAGNGIVYGFFSDCEAAAHWLKGVRWPGVLEWVPPRSCSEDEQWPRPGNDLDTMKKIKLLFDPGHLLNRGRLYGRL